MKNIIFNSFIVFLVIVNVCVGTMIYSGLKPKCFVEGCSCARIERSLYCRKHIDTGNDIWLKAKNRN